MKGFFKGGVTPLPMEKVCTNFGASSKAVIPLLIEQKKIIGVEKGLCFHTHGTRQIKGKP